eukprot:TRINITY_DN4814_c3_g1_i1.p1 TRINITY_DN4814_c3_g1~~TRINITY_DN4814_c3_g1_i1.p1  ORF type:complete len:1232 (+),score=356.33 TRINITY_DN4814_c3_g1_i1:121-3696(+)
MKQRPTSSQGAPSPAALTTPVVPHLENTVPRQYQRRRFHPGAAPLPLGSAKALGMTQSFTLALWVCPNYDTVHLQPLSELGVLAAGTPATDAHLQVTLQAGRTLAVAFNGEALLRGTAGPSVPEGEWTHVVVHVDNTAGTVAVTVDQGEPVTRSVGPNLLTGSERVTLGAVTMEDDGTRDAPAQACAFSGAVDAVNIIPHLAPPAWCAAAYEARPAPPAARPAPPARPPPRTRPARPGVVVNTPYGPLGAAKGAHPIHGKVVSLDPFLHSRRHGGLIDRAYCAPEPPHRRGVAGVAPRAARGTKYLLAATTRGAPKDEEGGADAMAATCPAALATLVGSAAGGDGEEREGVAVLSAHATACALCGAAARLPDPRRFHEGALRVQHGLGGATPVSRLRDLYAEEALTLIDAVEEAVRRASRIPGAPLTLYAFSASDAPPDAPAPALPAVRWMIVASEATPASPRWGAASPFCTDSPLTRQWVVLACDVPPDRFLYTHAAPVPAAGGAPGASVHTHAQLLAASVADEIHRMLAELRDDGEEGADVRVCFAGHGVAGAVAQALHVGYPAKSECVVFGAPCVVAGGAAAAAGPRTYYVHGSDVVPRAFTASVLRDRATLARMGYAGAAVADPADAAWAGYMPGMFADGGGAVVVLQAARGAPASAVRDEEALVAAMSDGVAVKACGADHALTKYIRALLGHGALPHWDDAVRGFAVPAKRTRNSALPLAPPPHGRRQLFTPEGALRDGVPEAMAAAFMAGGTAPEVAIQKFFVAVCGFTIPPSLAAEMAGGGPRAWAEALCRRCPDLVVRGLARAGFDLAVARGGRLAVQRLRGSRVPDDAAVTAMMRHADGNGCHALLSVTAPILPGPAPAPPAIADAPDSDGLGGALVVRGDGPGPGPGPDGAPPEPGEDDAGDGVLLSDAGRRLAGDLFAAAVERQLARRKRAQGLLSPQGLAELVHRLVGRAVPAGVYLAPMRWFTPRAPAVDIAGWYTLAGFAAVFKWMLLTEGEAAVWERLRGLGMTPEATFPNGPAASGLFPKQGLAEADAPRPPLPRPPRLPRNLGAAENAAASQEAAAAARTKKRLATKLLKAYEDSGVNLHALARRAPPAAGRARRKRDASRALQTLKHDIHSERKVWKRTLRKTRAKVAPPDYMAMVDVSKQLVNIMDARGDDKAMPQDVQPDEEPVSLPLLLE